MLQRRTDELVRTWLVRVVDDLSLREVGALRLGATVEGFLDIYGFVIDAARAALDGEPPPGADELCLRMGRTARESTVRDSDGARAVAALGRLQDLLNLELRGSAVAASGPDADPTVKAVASVFERLRDAVMDDAATDRAGRESEAGAGGPAA